MYTRYYELDAYLLIGDRHLVTSPDFPDGSVEVSALDAHEAMARAHPWLASCIIAGFRDR